MRSNLRPVASVGLLFAAEVAAVITLHRLGHVPELVVPLGDLRGWLEATDPEVVLVAVGRVVALALAWWLLGSTALYALAHGLRRDALAAAISLMTLPAARRVLDRSVAGAVLATALFVRSPVASAGASPSPPVDAAEPRSGRLDPAAAPQPEDIRVGRTQPPTSPPSSAVPPPAPIPTDEPSTPPAPPAPSPTPDPGPAAPDPGPVPAAGAYVVGPGDNLWVIAARQLAAPGRSVAAVPAAEIAPYWHGLIERNGPHLRSGDPNLIFPGEVIELPPRVTP